MFILIILCVLILVFLVKTIASFQKNEQQQETGKEATMSDISSSESSNAHELKFFCIKDKGYHVSVWPNVDGYVDLDYIEFDIAGIRHYKHAAMQRIGETLGFLAAEPDNPYDSNAIRIMTPDWRCVGYVPRDRTSEIRQHTKLPCPCFFYIGVRVENGEAAFYTDAYIRLDIVNK